MERVMIADLILKELYEFYRKKICSLTKVLVEAHIFTKGHHNLFSVAKQLELDNFVELKGPEHNLHAKLTPQGIQFCENSSYTYPDHPIITHKGT